MLEVMAALVFAVFFQFMVLAVIEAVSRASLFVKDQVNQL